MSDRGKNDPLGGALIVCCIAAAGAGLAISFAFERDPAFWVGDRRAGGLAIGAAAAALLLLARHVSEIVFRPRERRRRDAAPDA